MLTRYTETLLRTETVRNGSAFIFWKDGKSTVNFCLS